MAEYPKILVELDKFNSTYQNTLNIVTIDAIQTAVADIKNSFTASTFSTKGLIVKDINDIDFDKGVVDKIDNQETDLIDLSLNIHTNPSMVSINVSNKVNENDIPIHYTQSFKLPTGMDAGLTVWGQGSRLNHNTQTFQETKFRSSISCFEAYKVNDETRFRLKTNDYAGNWRVDFRMNIGAEADFGVHNYVLKLHSRSHYVKVSKHIYRKNNFSNLTLYLCLGASGIFSVADTADYFDFETRLMAINRDATNLWFNITDFDITFTYMGK